MPGDDSTTATQEVADRLKSKDLSEADLLEIRSQVYGSGRERRRVERQIAAAETAGIGDDRDAAVAHGLAQFVAGKLPDAIETLNKARGSRLASFALGHSLLET